VTFCQTSLPRLTIENQLNLRQSVSPLIHYFNSGLIVLYLDSLHLVAKYFFQGSPYKHRSSSGPKYTSYSQPFNKVDRGFEFSLVMYAHLVIQVRVVLRCLLEPVIPVAARFDGRLFRFSRLLFSGLSFSSIELRPPRRPNGIPPDTLQQKHYLFLSFRVICRCLSSRARCHYQLRRNLRTPDS
jgi:hypothetical protein